MIHSLAKNKYSCSDLRDRVAFKHLSSNLHYLELLGVEVADRCSFVKGQKEDEQSHANAFEEIASSNGGLLPISIEMRGVYSSILSHSPELSGFILNYLGEAWLGEMMQGLKELGFCTDLILEIVSDEDRHIEEIKKRELPSVTEEYITKAISDLERALFYLTTSSSFMLPFVWLFGISDTTRLGERAIKSYLRALKSLGLAPTRSAKKIAVGCKVARAKFSTYPREVSLTYWDKTRLNHFDHRNPMLGCFEIPALSKESSFRFLTRVVQAVSFGLSVYPSMNRTIRANKIYHPENILIGIRLSDSDVGFATIYIEDPHLRTSKEVSSILVNKLKKIRKRVLQEIPSFGELEDFIPPSKCAITISYAGSKADGFMGYGYSPLTSAEGASSSLQIGSRFENKAILGLATDHRCCEGSDMVQFMKAVSQELSGGTISNRRS